MLAAPMHKVATMIRSTRPCASALLLMLAACQQTDEEEAERVALTLGLTWTLEGEAASTSSCPSGSTVTVGTCAAPPGTPDASLGAPRDCALGTTDFNIFVPLGDVCLVARLNDRFGQSLYEEGMAVSVLVAGQRADRAVDFDLAGDGGRPGGGGGGGGTLIDAGDDAGGETDAGGTIDVLDVAEDDAASDVSATPYLVECICGDGAAVLEECVAEVCTRTGEAADGVCDRICGERGFSGSVCYRSAPACR